MQRKDRAKNRVLQLLMPIELCDIISQYSVDCMETIIIKTFKKLINETSSICCSDIIFTMTLHLSKRREYITIKIENQRYGKKIFRWDIPAMARLLNNMPFLTLKINKLCVEVSSLTMGGPLWPTKNLVQSIMNLFQLIY